MDKLFVVTRGCGYYNDDDDDGYYETIGVFDDYNKASTCITNLAQKNGFIIETATLFDMFYVTNTSFDYDYYSIEEFELNEYNDLEEGKRKWITLER